MEDNRDIKKFLAGYCERSPESVFPESHLYHDLHLTEVDMQYSIVPKIESLLCAEIPDEQIEELNTVQDLVDLCSTQT